MKTTKYTLFFFTLLKFGGQAFFLSLFAFSLSFAQEETQKTKVEEKSDVEKPNSTQAITDKIEFKNSATNSILTITDEGSNAASILIPPGSVLTDSNNNDKLYNVSGTLYWNGDAIGTAVSAGGWTHSGTNIYNTTLTDKVGIGVSTPQEDFHIANGKRVLWGTSTIGNGDKLMFLPNLHAFRVGYISSGAGSTYWNPDSIGLYSFASGYNTRAQGFGATAMGRDTEATNSYAFASGYFTNADGQYSTAMGFNADALALGSTAIGNSADAKAIYAVALGSYNVGFGSPTDWVSTDPIFELGIGQSGTTRTNAMTVLKNGKVGIGTINPLSKLSVGGLGNSSAAISGDATTGWGVYGKATTGRGVFGSANGTDGEGVIAEAHGENGRAISGYASGVNGLAGNFVGDVNISGSTTIGNDIEISGSTKLGTTGTPFLEIREITGTTAPSSFFTDISNALPVGWTGIKTRVLSLEIKFLEVTWHGIGTVRDGLHISYSIYDNSRSIRIRHPNYYGYHSKPWRAIIMRMP